MCRLSDALLESSSVGFAAWSSLGSVLERELGRSEAAGLILAAGEAAAAAELQEQLIGLAHGLTPEDLGEDLLEIFRAFSRLLALLRFIEVSLKGDTQLKRLLPVFTLVHEETRALLDFIEGRALRVEGVARGASEILDGTAYAVRMELRKAFEHELTGLCSVRPAAAALREGRERDAGFCATVTSSRSSRSRRASSPGSTAGRSSARSRPSSNSRSNCGASCGSSSCSWRAPRPTGTSRPRGTCSKRLDAFGEGSQRYLMYKDWEALERFAEEIDSARDAGELSRTLHRFEAYLETLFGQVSMRAILADRPFDPKSPDS